MLQKKKKINPRVCNAEKEDERSQVIFSDFVGEGPLILDTSILGSILGLLRPGWNERLENMLVISFFEGFYTFHNI